MMNRSEIRELVQLVKDVMAYYRQDVSPFMLQVWEDACAPFSYEQVKKAMNRHVTNPENGQFAPKVADIVRILQGTHTDRALLAWGKALEAMRSVGAYQNVVFDDPAIHACIEDLGGWPKLCRTEIDELHFAQKRFCDSHKAYTGRGTFEYQRRLAGDCSPDEMYLRRGLPVPIVMIGDPKLCESVYAHGSKSGKTMITFQTIDRLALGNTPREPRKALSEFPEGDEDERYD